MKSKKVWLVVLLTFVLVFSAGCSSQPASTPAPAPAATPQEQPKELVPFKIGIPVSPPNLVHLPPYVALEQGYFEEVGLLVTPEDLVEFEGGLQSLRGSAAGGLDVGGTSADPLIIAAAAGGGVKGIGVYASKLDTSMVVQPGINSIEDLRGKKIGIQEVGGFSEVMARALLASVGMTPDDVQYVTVSTSGRVTGLATGQIDAAPLHVDQYYSALAMKGDLQIVANMWDVLPEWWYSAYMVTEDQLADPEQRANLVAFEMAIIKAQRFIYENKDETIAIAQKYSKAGKEALEKSYDLLVEGGIWAVNDGMPRNMVEYTIDKQIEIGTIEEKNKPSYEDVIDSSIAEEALKNLGGRMTGDPRWY